MKPFDVSPYLRDIDAEIVAHRQEIAKHQVRIQQLQDMRVLMMAREEDRAAGLGLTSPFGTLPEGAEIAVRDPLTYQPWASPAPALAAPQDQVNGHAVEDRRERQRASRRDYKREYRKRASQEAKLRRRLEVAKEYGATGLDTARKGGTTRRVTEPVERVFLDRPSTPLTAKEVMDAVFADHVPSKAEKQRVYQSLYDLKERGLLHQSRAGEPYTMEHRP